VLLLDAHCHAITAEELDADAFALWCTEASVPPPPGVSYLDGPAGLAIRRWCAPVLDLPAHAPAEEYLARRAELGAVEASRRLLRAAGLAELLVDTGLPGGLTGPALAETAGAGYAEVVRLEAVAERVAAAGVSAESFAAAFDDALAEAIREAAAVKSILAYRCGLDIDPRRPARREVTEAAGQWLGANAKRLADAVLLRHLLWSAVDLGLPIQLHTGFGDRDLSLPRSDPSLLQPWLAAVEPSGVPIVLLHCYPYHRQAGWLAHVYPNVYLDVGLTLTHTGPRAAAVLAEYFELAPFGKILYSSDAYGLAELYLVGAEQFRWSLSALVEQWPDAERVAHAVGADNARRVYRR
jgi:predicted TIM-barrel fold metal-dependent hydrolase